jgi:hypothetical protein
MDGWKGKEQTPLSSPFRQAIFDTVAAGFDRAVITSSAGRTLRFPIFSELIRGPHHTV